MWVNQLVVPIIALLCLMPRLSLSDTLYIPYSDRNTHTLRNQQELQIDGNYHYAYETSNGISAKQAGLGGVAVQGDSSYTAPDGSIISLRYVADETGYHPIGDHIPKVPDYILRALEYIRNHPYQVRDYYSGELKTVSHDNEAFKVYTRNIAESTTPVPRPRNTTPKVVYLTHAPPSATQANSPALRRLKRQSRSSIR
ncbi:pupal cuticle protein [Scaptodrosophila lebanonensis]|uniref:Pupal cuticle protein n=1 Tax=Drosophila lebanonensis TaxID=7225 RepID=A0A6J2TRK3_DROLE|nr:pupal cuticle protein [Scaptodrosophila lebanonensis]